MKVKNKGIFFKILIKQIKQFEISVENIWRKFELKNQKKKKIRVFDLVYIWWKNVRYSKICWQGRKAGWKKKNTYEK